MDKQFSDLDLTFEPADSYATAASALADREKRDARSGRNLFRFGSINLIFGFAVLSGYISQDLLGMPVVDSSDAYPHSFEAVLRGAFGALVMLVGFLVWILGVLLYSFWRKEWVLIVMWTSLLISVWAFCARAAYPLHQDLYMPPVPQHCLTSECR